MTTTRTDTATRFIRAPAASIYAAWVSRTALEHWLPPAGMSGRMTQFDPRPGGSYRMILTYDDPAVPGKAGDNTDIAVVHYVELVPDRRIVQRVAFDSPDPAFAGSMTMTWSLDPVPGGTDVTIRCEDVPPGIDAQDHAKGLSSSLDNLAAYVSKAGPALPG